MANKKVSEIEEEKDIRSSLVRSRTFATIVYEESAKENWRDELEALHIPVLVSPVHDRDVDPNGNLKR